MFDHLCVIVDSPSTAAGCHPNLQLVARQVIADGQFYCDFYSLFYVMANIVYLRACLITQQQAELLI